MSISAFKPCRKEMYSVDFGQMLDSFNVEIGPSPMPKTIIIQSPSPMVFNKNMTPTPRVPRIKKKWGANLKKAAVAKAKEIGLTKATRFLQSNFPNEFGELSPSTLQYWIQKFE